MCHVCFVTKISPLCMQVECGELKGEFHTADQDFTIHEREELVTGPKLKDLGGKKSLANGRRPMLDGVKTVAL